MRMFGLSRVVGDIGWQVNRQAECLPHPRTLDLSMWGRRFRLPFTTSVMRSVVGNIGWQVNRQAQCSIPLSFPEAYQAFEKPLPRGHGSVESVRDRAVTARLQGCGKTKWHWAECLSHTSRTCRLPFAFSVISLILLHSTLQAQVAVEANTGYKTPEARAGIAKTLSSDERDSHQRPKDLIAALGVKPGMHVADIGTGVGYMLPFFSEAVGDKGYIVAEDIFPDFLAKAKQLAASKGLKNVEFIQGTDKNPSLKQNSLDLALVLDVYHHFDYPAEMLAAIRAALKSKGRLAICEYYKRVGAMGDPTSDRAVKHIRLDEADVIKEIEANGFKLVKSDEFNPKSQYLAIFEKQ